MWKGCTGMLMASDSWRTFSGINGNRTGEGGTSRVSIDSVLYIGTFPPLCLQDLLNRPVSATGVLQLSDKRVEQCGRYHKTGNILSMYRSHLRPLIRRWGSASPDKKDLVGRYLDLQCVHV